ncbi:MAG: hypothetical protein KC933_42240, partial [Myxococcales bacterium]|nr:hypothetical protein [Myxococcales bacterium]
GPCLSDAPYCELPRARVSLKAWTQRVPEALVSALLDPGPMLVVGDAPGDPDCFCSAVAVARARRALGLPAQAHVDAPPPKQIGALLRADELADRGAVADSAPCSSWTTTAPASGPPPRTRCGARRGWW